jgi:hypothetical protein
VGTLGRLLRAHDRDPMIHRSFTDQALAASNG